jgi:protein-disulfide isomerase
VAAAGRAALAVSLLLVAAGSAGAGQRLRVETGDSPTLGPAQAPVTVVEFVDYQ